MAPVEPGKETVKVEWEVGSVVVLEAITVTFAPCPARNGRMSTFSWSLSNAANCFLAIGCIKQLAA